MVDGLRRLEDGGIIHGLLSKQIRIGCHIKGNKKMKPFHTKILLCSVFVVILILIFIYNMKNENVTFIKMNHLLKNQKITTIEISNISGLVLKLSNKKKLEEYRKVILESTDLLKNTKEQTYFDAAISNLIKINLDSNHSINIGYAFDDVFFLNNITEGQYKFDSPALRKLLEQDISTNPNKPQSP